MGLMSLRSRFKMGLMNLIICMGLMNLLRILSGFRGRLRRRESRKRENLMGEVRKKYFKNKIRSYNN